MSSRPDDAAPRAVASRAAWHNAADTLRELGGLNAALYWTSRAAAAATGGRARIVKYVLVAQPVPPPSGVASARTGIARVLPGDPIVAQFPRPTAVIAQRFASGAVCYAARGNGRFTGFIWLKRNGYDEDEVRCRYDTEPRASTAWDFDVYVDPAHRMGRTFVRLWQAAHVQLREWGVEWTVSRISAFNAASLRAHARSGATPLASATFVCLGPVQLMLATVRPFVHLSLARSRPCFRLHAPNRCGTR
jgi:hypothetical protein